MSEQQPTMWEDLVRSIVGLPKYVLGWTGGLVIAILSDLHMTTLAVTGVVAGFALDSWLWGVVAFFALYSLSRVVSTLANAIGFGAQGIAQATARAGQTFAGVFSQAAEQHEQTVERPGVDFVG